MSHGTSSAKPRLRLLVRPRYRRRVASALSPRGRSCPVRARYDSIKNARHAFGRTGGVESSRNSFAAASPRDPAGSLRSGMADFAEERRRNHYTEVNAFGVFPDLLAVHPLLSLRARIFFPTRDRAVERGDEQAGAFAGVVGGGLFAGVSRGSETRENGHAAFAECRARIRSPTKPLICGGACARRRPSISGSWRFA
jgi:hypothetical protein